MSLFVQSLMALATTVSPAPSAPATAHEAAPPVSIEASKVDFASNLMTKFGDVAPLPMRPPIWGRVWPQTTWAEAYPRSATDMSVSTVSPVHALELVTRDLK
jgi:hypothetical protein